jgi:hypothetical protein
MMSMEYNCVFPTLGTYRIKTDQYGKGFWGVVMKIGWEGGGGRLFG